MEHGEKHPQSIFSASRDDREDERVFACHRMLMYMHGLDIKAQPSLDLASDCLRRAGPDAGLEAILDEMHRSLKGHGLEMPLADNHGHPLRSSPPMRRRSMIATEECHISLLRRLTGFFAKKPARERAGLRGSPL